MSTIWAAWIGAGAVVFVAALSGAGAYVRHYMKRYDKALYAAEQRIDKLEGSQRKYWLWTRKLIDKIYKMGGEPPAPPKGLFDD